MKTKTKQYSTIYAGTAHRRGLGPVALTLVLLRMVLRMVLLLLVANDGKNSDGKNNDDKNNDGKITFSCNNNTSENTDTSATLTEYYSED
jgi:hypothetical protein